MATNVKITAHRNDENLHLKLKGDFDGTSAYELLNIVRKRAAIHHGYSYIPAT